MRPWRRSTTGPISCPRGLRHGETHTIGLVAPDSAIPFFAEIFRVVEDLRLERGHSVTLGNTGDDLATEVAYIDVLFAKQVDGISLIAACDHREHMNELRLQNIPLVLADRYGFMNR